MVSPGLELRAVDGGLSVKELAEKIEAALRFADEIGAPATALWLDRALVEAIDEARRRGATVDGPDHTSPYGRVLIDGRD